MLAKEEDGFVIEGEGDNDRFMVVQKGDNLVTSFQCDWYHFRNIKGKFSRIARVNDELLLFIRRDNLDKL